MIMFYAKGEALSSAPKAESVSTKENGNALSFSELLKGANYAKVVQNGALVLSLEPEKTTSQNTKSSLKNGVPFSFTRQEVSALPATKPLNAVNEKIISYSDFKVLLKEAKEYLITKIEENPEYKKLQSKELPRTIKGLLAVAKTFSIDISKVTLEKVQVNTKTQTEPTPKINNKVVPLTLKSDSINVKEALVKLEVKQEKVGLKEALIKTDIKQEAPTVKTLLAKPELKPENSGLRTPIVKTDIKQEAPTVKTLLAKPELKQESKEAASKIKEILVKTEITSRVKHEAPSIKTVPTILQTKQDISSNDETQRVIQTQVREQIKPQEILKSTPLVKLQIYSQHTTEQLVATKQFKVEGSRPKDKSDETLKLLLRSSSKTLAQGSTLTADFTVATAKVIVSSNATQLPENLQSLLKNDNAQIETTSKIDGLNVHKPDSFEVKLNEAKQMTKYLSQDVKTAIEDYKSPFTRVKVQLNPQKLGEIDLTIVQRGKNLHINLSSNNTAINALALNVNDLKIQLSNNGINNASLNFNNNSYSENSSSFGQQQQNFQNQRQAKEEYQTNQSFDSEEMTEEILSSLEIVVPNYA